MNHLSPRRALPLLAVLIILLLAFPSTALASDGIWTWMSGVSTTRVPGVYGTQGIPHPANLPGARAGSISWIDDVGNLWLFGGYGRDSAGNEGQLNDLWRYGVDGQWIWVSGANTVRQAGVYGVKGVPDPANVPGGRERSISWIDGAGNLWLFGGFGSGSNGNWANYLNDLWRYDVANGQWTWMSGSNTFGQAGVYGIQGAPQPTNVPGARGNSISWIDGAGNLWLMGGYGNDSTDSWGHLNDLWRYDGAAGLWTWMSGANLASQAGIYGIRGTPDPANVPGARRHSISWIDGAGNLWLFGGEGRDSAGYLSKLNDLWRYDTNGEWTWMSGASTIDQAGVYGVQGAPDPANVPGARTSSISWIDSAGNLWLFGGSGRDSTNSSGNLNDLWRYDVVVGQWIWMSGANTRNQRGIYGVQGAPHLANVPGGRERSISWIDGAGNLWLHGGGGRDSSGYAGYLNDLWRYDANGEWTWMSGLSTIRLPGVYGIQGIPHPANVPGARYWGISWIDGADNLWLFGGLGHDSSGNEGLLNDLWRYGTNGQWTWISGSNMVEQPGVYGAQGGPSPAAVPGARQDSISWIDGAGNLWLFGGLGRDGTVHQGLLNDLWRYDVDHSQWTWISGADTAEQPGVYGIQGTPGPASTPGGRKGSNSWIDGDGNLWLFGGWGIDSGGSRGRLNDLWRYDANGEWTWMSGANTVEQSGVYGTQGTPDPANVPGARWGSNSWTDGTGNLWIFGGWGFASASSPGLLNDLWQYDANGQWTWVSGANTTFQIGVYGTQGTPHPANVPGARQDSISWTDGAGNLWLFGGTGLDGANSPGRLNDLWHYDVAGGQWTWISGANTAGQAGVYGVLGTPHLANMPGGRDRSISWIDGAGNLWLLGGLGRDSAGNEGMLNDLWRYFIQPPTAVTLTGLEAGGEAGIGWGWLLALAASGLALAAALAGRRNGQARLR